MNVKDNIEEITVRKILNILDNKKAEDIKVFDLKNTKYFTDNVIIATALAAKHALSIVDAIKDNLAKDEKRGMIVDIGDDWIVADIGNILIHIFTQNHRKKFNIENLLDDIIKQKIYK